MGQYILSHRTSYGVKELTLEPPIEGGCVKELALELEEGAVKN